MSKFNAYCTILTMKNFIQNKKLQIITVGERTLKVCNKEEESFTRMELDLGSKSEITFC